MDANTALGFQKYPHVFDPVEIRGKVYKNRLIAAPTLFAHSIFTYPEIAENVYRMVENRAKGGFAAVSTGEICINFEEGIVAFVDEPIDYKKHEGSDFVKMSEYARRIKRHGAIAYLEFSHEGSEALVEPPYEPWGPVAFERPDGIDVLAYDEEKMKKTCDDMETACEFARACGFDGVLFHGGHGFIIQQFISPLRNTRTDEYGGSIENRSRFPKMLLEAARRGLGEDMILEVRISAEDGVPGGMTIDDTVEFCKLIDGMPDIIHISTGTKEAGNASKCNGDIYDPHGHNADHAAKVKAAVKKSKVAVIGGINDPALCESIIAEGKADFTVLARQCFADPDFPVKAMMGRDEYIRRCVRCNNCYPGMPEHPTDIPIWVRMGTPEGQEIYSPTSMGKCAINPKSGGFTYYADRLPMPEEARKVLIIGGGVAGLQAAITAKERGHWVTLVEQTDKLGGTVNFTDHDFDKVDLMNFKNLLIREARECCAEILMNTKADKALFEKLQPDIILAAVGARPSRPPIKGIENAMDAVTVFENMDKIGDSVVMIGGGLVGCEVAIHLAKNGHKVTVVEAQSRVAPESLGCSRNALMEELEKCGIQQLLNTPCVEIKQNSVVVDKGSSLLEITADSCVVSLGMKPNIDIVQEIQDIAGSIPVKAIGDCTAPGKIATAVRTGYDAAMAVI